MSKSYASGKCVAASIAKRKMLHVAAIAGLLGFSAPAFASSDTWTGSDTPANNKWSDPLNWGGIAPQANDALIFSGSTGLAPVNDFTAGTQFGGITFDNSAGLFVVTGNLVNLGGDIVNNSASVQAVNLKLALQQATNLNAASGDLAFGGIISGAFGITLPGVDNVTLSGANTYTGGTTVSGGTLILGSNTAAGTGTLTLAGGALQASATRTIANAVSLSASSIIKGNSLTITGLTSATGAGALTNNISSGSLLQLTGGLELGATGHASTFTFNGTGAATVGVITDSSASVPVTIAGGTVTFSGLNSTFAGGTTVSGGTLILANTNVLGSGTLNLSGGTLAASGTQTVTNPVNFVSNSTVAGSGTMTLSGVLSATGADTLTNNSTGALTMSNSLDLGAAGHAASFQISGTGTTAISGAIVDTSGAAVPLTIDSAVALSGTNTYAGNTTLSVNGALTLGSAAALGTGALLVNGGSIQSSTPITVANAVHLNANAGISGFTDLTLSGAISATGATALTNNLSGGTFTLSGSLDLGATNHAAAFTISGGGTTVISANITDSSGVVPLTIDGSLGGTFTLGGSASTYAAGTNITNGAVVIINSNNAMGAGKVVFGGSSDLQTTSPRVIPNNVEMPTNAFTDGALTINGSFTFTGANTLTTNTVGNSLTLAGNVFLSNSLSTPRTVIINTGPDSTNLVTLSGQIADSNGAGGTVNLKASGPGTVVISHANPTWSGGVTIDSGILSVANSTALGTGPITFTNTGTLRFSGVNPDLSSQIKISTKDALIDTNSQNVTFASAITSTGAGKLTKLGLGSLTLSGPSTFTGGVSANAGTLVIGANSTSSTVGPLGNASGSLVFNGGVVQAGASDVSVVNPFQLSLDSTVSGSSSITTTAKFTVNASKTLTNNIVSGKKLTVGQLSLSTGFTSRILTLAGAGDMVVTGTVDQGSSSSSGIIRTGTGMLTLSGSSISVGTNTINGGTLLLGTSGVLPSGTITDNLGGAVGYAGGIQNAAFLAKLQTNTGGALAIQSATDASTSINFNTAPAAWNNMGLGAVNNAASYTYSGTLTPNGLNWRLGGGNGTLNYNAILNDANGAGTNLIILGGGNGTVSLGAVESYTGNTTVNANETLLVNSAAGLPATTTLTTTGTTTFAAGASGIKTRTLAGATINAGGQVNIANPALHANRTVLTTGSLAFAGSTGAWAGKLDLAGNDLVVHNASAAAATTTAANVADQLKQGFNLANSGFWNGSAGIVSSTAAGDGTHLTTLGTILNNDGTGNVVYGSFDGQTVTTTDVLVKYTYFGDADLSGKVDGTDYSKIDNGFNNHLTGWFNGDFNYDGVVDGSDYSLIDNAFNTQGASLGSGTSFANSASSMVAGTASEVGISLDSSSAVPEPGSLSLLGIGGMGLLRRRRRL